MYVHSDQHILVRIFFYNMQLLKIGQILDVEYSYVRYLQLILDITKCLVSESEYECVSYIE